VSHRSVLMLYAFALEAMLKTLWLAQVNQAARVPPEPTLPPPVPDLPTQTFADPRLRHRQSS
jgi:hypothetical protein